MVKKNEHSLKIVKFNDFFDFLALALSLSPSFSDYYKLFKIINGDKNIEILNNFDDCYKLLDLIYDNYNKSTDVKLLYNDEALLAYINSGKYYYHILVNINHKIFKSYKNMPNFINELEDFIKAF